MLLALPFVSETRAQGQRLPQPSLTAGNAAGRAGQGLAVQSRLWVSSRHWRFWLDTRVAKPSPQVAEQALHAVPHSGQGNRSTGVTARKERGETGWRQVLCICPAVLQAKPCVAEKPVRCLLLMFHSLG